MADAPPFDPSQPFEQVSSAPPFDPSKPFEEVKAGSQLPDLGPPMFNFGTEETPPILMPEVNKWVNEKLAPSVNRNLIEPIKHPLDTLGGIGRVGAGLAQYATQGELGTGFEPDVDALAEDYKKTYGSMEGFKDALINDPARVAADASGVFGILRGVGRRAGLVSRPAGHVPAPTTQELYDASQNNYRNMKGYGVELHPHVMDSVATNIMTELEGEGYRDYLTPKTFRAVEELRNPVGQNHTIGDIDGARKALNKASLDPAERDAARRAIIQIDTAMTGLTPADAAVNDHFVHHVVGEANRARGNYAAFKQAETIEEATDRAALQAASTGSGANIDNATRQKYRAILTNPKKLRGYSQEEQQAMRQLVQGTTGGNAARLVGKLAPSGVVSGALSAGLGHTVGHTVGVPLVGYIAKQLADGATARRAARLSELRRLRSPLAQQRGSVPHPGNAPPIGGAMQLGRLGNMVQNPYAPPEQP